MPSVGFLKMLMPKRDQWRKNLLPRIEAGFLVTFLAVSLRHYALKAKSVEGFDAGAYWEVYQKIRIGSRLPGVRELWESYNPPLAFWIADIFHRIGGTNVPSTLAFTMLCIVFGFLCLRETLAHLRLLHTLQGIVFLYTAAALPIFVFLSTEMGIDGAVFFFAMLVLMLSTEAFYESGDRSFRRSAMEVLCLTLALAASAMTKVSGFTAFSIPFVVVLACRHPAPLRNRFFLTAMLSCVLAGALVSPFFYMHYYRAEGSFIAISMEWWGGSPLKQHRAERDKAPVQFLLDYLSVPAKPMQSLDRPIDKSVWGRVWFDLWKRDSFLGAALPLVTVFSHAEAWIFFFLFAIGFILFFFRCGNRDSWTVFGRILFGMSIFYLIAILKFGYEYPFYEWGVFKAKYIAAGLLFVPYAATIFVMAIHEELRSERLRTFFLAIMLCLVFFLLSVNYLLPVY